MNQNEPKHVPGDPLATLVTCNGYYECPKGPEGERRGPLVGYAACYEPDMHYVGDVYLNGAAIETYPWILAAMASELAAQLEKCDWIMGVPEGGKTLATLVALHMRIPYIYPEKQVTRVGTESQRGESRFVMRRHEIPPKSKGIILEDVVNNLSSAREVIDHVESHNAEVTAIGCLFNRSIHEMFEHGRPHPIVSLLQVPLLQYKQTDPAVLADIEAVNIVWQPKTEWPRLMTIMANAEERAHGAPTTG